jgi:hypothetical protein
MVLNHDRLTKVEPGLAKLEIRSASSYLTLEANYYKVFSFCLQILKGDDRSAVLAVIVGTGTRLRCRHLHI